jgi:hypothetical protein
MSRITVRQIAARFPGGALSTRKRRVCGILSGFGDGWQRACEVHLVRMRRNHMLDSVRKHVTIPYVPGRVLLSAATVGSFAWLLAHDMIHPLVIYALQLYLSF